MKQEFFEYLFGMSPDKVPENIILTPFFSPKRFGSYCEIVSFFKGAIYSGALCRKEGKEFGIVKCGIGAGIAGDCVIGLGKTPAKNIIFIGSAGGLNDAKVGDILIAESAYAGEGFSRYHDDKLLFVDIIKEACSFGSDRVLSDKIEKKIKDNTSADIVKKGKIFTIGSLTAETENNLKALERGGFSGVEMEASAILQAAKKINTKAAGVLFISDEPLLNPLWKELEKDQINKYNYSVDVIIKNVVDLYGEE